MGQDDLAAGDLLPHRRAGRAPGRRGRGRPGRGQPRDRDGAARRSGRSRSRRSSRPTRRRSSSSTGPASKDQILARVERAQRAGAVGLIVTLDWSFSMGRDWGSPAIPETMNLRTMVRYGAAGHRPAALVLHLGQDAAAAGPHRAEHGRRRAAGARRSSARTGSGCRRRCRPGRTCAGCGSSGAGRSCSRASSGSTTPGGRWTPGVTAISVSNHGGNNLDGTPATIRALPAGRRRRGRPDRGAARRRRPARVGRGQGGGDGRAAPS